MHSNCAVVILCSSLLILKCCIITNAGPVTSLSWRDSFAPDQQGVLIRLRTDLHSAVENFYEYFSFFQKRADAGMSPTARRGLDSASANTAEDESVSGADGDDPVHRMRIDLDASNLEHSAPGAPGEEVVDDDAIETRILDASASSDALGNEEAATGLKDGSEDAVGGRNGLVDGQETPAADPDDQVSARTSLGQDKTADPADQGTLSTDDLTLKTSLAQSGLDETAVPAVRTGQNSAPAFESRKHSIPVHTDGIANRINIINSPNSRLASIPGSTRYANSLPDDHLASRININGAPQTIDGRNLLPGKTYLTPESSRRNIPSETNEGNKFAPAARRNISPGGGDVASRINPNGAPEAIEDGQLTPGAVQNRNLAPNAALNAPGLRRNSKTIPEENIARRINNNGAPEAAIDDSNVSPDETQNRNLAPGLRRNSKTIPQTNLARRNNNNNDVPKANEDTNNEIQNRNLAPNAVQTNNFAPNAPGLRQYSKTIPVVSFGRKNNNNEAPETIDDSNVSPDAIQYRNLALNAAQTNNFAPNIPGLRRNDKTIPGENLARRTNNNDAPEANENTNLSPENRNLAPNSAQTNNFTPNTPGLRRNGKTIPGENLARRTNNNDAPEANEDTNDAAQNRNLAPNAVQTNNFAPNTPGLRRNGKTIPGENLARRNNNNDAPEANEDNNDAAQNRNLAPNAVQTNNFAPNTPGLRRNGKTIPGENLARRNNNNAAPETNKDNNLSPENRNLAPNAAQTNNFAPNFPASRRNSKTIPGENLTRRNNNNETPEANEDNNLSPDAIQNRNLAPNAALNAPGLRRNSKTIPGENLARRTNTNEAPEANENSNLSPDAIQNRNLALDSTNLAPNLQARRNGQTTPNDDVANETPDENLAPGEDSRRNGPAAILDNDSINANSRRNSKTVPDDDVASRTNLNEEPSAAEPARKNTNNEFEQAENQDPLRKNTDDESALPGNDALDSNADTPEARTNLENDETPEARKNLDNTDQANKNNPLTDNANDDIAPRTGLTNSDNGLTTFEGGVTPSDLTTPELRTTLGGNTATTTLSEAPSQETLAPAQEITGRNGLNAALDEETRSTNVDDDPQMRSVTIPEENEEKLLREGLQTIMHRLKALKKSKNGDLNDMFVKINLNSEEDPIKVIDHPESLTTSLPGYRSLDNIDQKITDELMARSNFEDPVSEPEKRSNVDDDSKAGIDEDKMAAAPEEIAERINIPVDEENAGKRRNAGDEANNDETPIDENNAELRRNVDGNEEPFNAEDISPIEEIEERNSFNSNPEPSENNAALNNPALRNNLNAGPQPQDDNLGQRNNLNNAVPDNSAALRRNAIPSAALQLSDNPAARNSLSAVPQPNTDNLALRNHLNNAVPDDSAALRHNINAIPSAALQQSDDPAARNNFNAIPQPNSEHLGRINHLNNAVPDDLAALRRNAIIQQSDNPAARNNFNAVPQPNSDNLARRNHLNNAVPNDSAALRRNINAVPSAALQPSDDPAARNNFNDVPQPNNDNLGRRNNVNNAVPDDSAALRRNINANPSAALQQSDDPAARNSFNAVPQPNSDHLGRRNHLVNAVPDDSAALRHNINAALQQSNDPAARSGLSSIPAAIGKKIFDTLGLRRNLNSAPGLNQNEAEDLNLRTNMNPVFAPNSGDPANPQQINRRMISPYPGLVQQQLPNQQLPGGKQNYPYGGPIDAIQITGLGEHSPVAKIEIDDLSHVAPPRTLTSEERQLVEQLVKLILEINKKRNTVTTRQRYEQRLPEVSLRNGNIAWAVQPIEIEKV